MTSEIAIFGDMKIRAIVGEDGQQYFSPRAVCDWLGVDWSTQRRKIMNDEILSSSVTQMTTVAQDGKQRKVAMMPVSRLAGWMLSFKEGKIRPELRPAMRAYKREAYAVLDAWFMKGQRNNCHQMESIVEKAIAKYQSRLDELLQSIQVSDAIGS